MKRLIISFSLILLIPVSELLLAPTISNALLNVHLKSEFGQAGSGPGQFISPQHIAIDKDGTIYLVDRGNRRVHVMTPDGRTLRDLWRRKIRERLS
jgi:sugar lactone lactonase YvrE